MPLIVHSSSTCDVCLNPYVFDHEGSQTPHTIPCGHIFCKNCLQSIVSTRVNLTFPMVNAGGVCPLCRKPFRDITAVRKLHMDGAPPDEPPPQEQVFLQRLFSLNWHSSEVTEEYETRHELVEEIETWLVDKPADEASDLRGALKALQEHRKNISRRRRAEAKAKDLEHRAVKAEKGSSLLEARVAQLLSEMDEIKAALKTAEEARTISRKGKEKEMNPLPVPPDDVTNRYGDYARQALREIPIGLAEAMRPIRYPPVEIFPYSEMDRVRAQEAAQPPSLNDVPSGVPTEAGVPIKKERKHRRKHRSVDVGVDNNMSQVTTRNNEVYPGGYVRAPFPVQVEEETPRAAPRSLDQRTVSFVPIPQPLQRIVSPQGSMMTWNTRNSHHSVATLGSIDHLRSSFAGVQIEDEALDVPVGDSRAFLPVHPTRAQTTGPSAIRPPFPLDEDSEIPRAFLPIHNNYINTPSSSYQMHSVPPIPLPPLSSQPQYQQRHRSESVDFYAHPHSQQVHSNEGGAANALGLQLNTSRTPTIAAPTPQIAARTFLRSFSSG